MAVREHLRRSILWGGPCGALAIVVFRDGTLYLLHHLFKVMPNWAFVTTIGWHGLPWIGWFIAIGAVGGVGIALLLRLVPLPDFIVGAALGLVAGFAVPQFMPAGTPDWVPLLVATAWGWGTVFLLRPLALRGQE